MPKVCCRGCRRYIDKAVAKSINLGYVCNEDCHLKGVKSYRKQQGRKSRGITDPSKEQKDAARTRDGFRCRWCGALDQIHVHHIYYRSQGGSHDEWNLITLCQGCHDKAHSVKKIYQPLLLGAQWLHYVVGLNRASPETVKRYLKSISPSP